MAEIRVEPKRGGARWLWLLIALVVVALVAWYFLSNRQDTTAPATGRAAPSAPELAAAPSASALRLAA